MRADWYKVMTDVTTSTAAGAFCGAVGSVALASRFFHVPIWPVGAWSPLFRIVVAVSALGLAAVFGLIAYATTPDAERHDRGTRIDKL